MTESGRLERDQVAVLIPALNESLRIREVVEGALVGAAQDLLPAQGVEQRAAGMAGYEGVPGFAVPRRDWVFRCPGLDFHVCPR